MIEKIINPKLLPFLCALVFFLVSFMTLGDYGPSWDEAVHFSRGQAYLNFFLTGKKDYSNVAGPRRSFYQFDHHTGEYWFNQNPGHPPVSDILAAASNKIFYQNLGVLNDVSSYHLFNILVSSFLIFVVVDFSLLTVGPFGAIISFLVLATYPLFFAESHFNVKDPAETAFFAATIWAFYKWRLSSFLFFGFALGTKFNILFLPFIVVPYLLLRGTKGIKLSRKTLFLGALGILAVAIIFVGTWPYLWSNWPESLLDVVGYYKNIALGTRYQPDSFYFLGFNSFPSLWILLTTPPVSLVLFAIGVMAILRDKKIFKNFGALFLFWFLVPIIRVSLPGTSVYGGIRQAMEFLPAFALISGLGANWLVQLIQKLKIKYQNYISKSKIFEPLFLNFKLYFCILIFAFLISPIWRLHPNENVYFNFLIGRLKGAQAKNFPSWGNSYGNAYLQGVRWLNENAEPNAKVTLIQGIEVNAPQILFRSDLAIANSFWSGINRQGEYIMELTFNDTGKAFYYGWEYVDKFLEPVYELKVDDVSILKIWKNDLEHTKSDFRYLERNFTKPIKIKISEPSITLDLGNEEQLSRIFLSFVPKEGCSPLKTTFMETSIDGINFNREKDWIPFPQLGNQSNLKDDLVEFFFAAREARYIRLVADNENSCALGIPKARVVVFSTK